MYSDVVLGLDHGAFEEALEIAKEDKGVHARHRAGGGATGSALVGRYKALVEEELGQAFPAGRARAALGRDRRGVRLAGSRDRAKIYRRLNDIPGDWGTAVNVQAMVFGNMGETSATGVAFTRDPSTGERAYYGEYLINAQGEDVVAGIRTPAISDAGRARESGREGAVDGRGDARGLSPSSPRVFDLLERHYRDMQDIEFTVERGQLWMLQTRTGKRTAKAALKIAVDMAERRADQRGGSGAARRSGGARPVAPPDARSRRRRAR